MMDFVRNASSIGSEIGRSEWPAEQDHVDCDWPPRVIPGGTRRVVIVECQAVGDEK